MNHSCYRILMSVAKEPVAGNTKTRLAKSIGFDAAASLYRCLLLDTLAVMRQVPKTTLALAYAPTSARATFAKLAPDMLLMPQIGSSFGERLNNALTHQLRQGGGYRFAAVLSSDTPLAEPTAIAEGFALLERGYDMAFGPCDDGGYYFLALHTPCSALFEGIEMSTPTVAAETLAAAEKKGLRVGLLPPTYDVDTFDDLERLRMEIRSKPPAVACHTRAWLAKSL
jgi:uncharacterized protein